MSTIHYLEVDGFLRLEPGRWYAVQGVPASAADEARGPFVRRSTAWAYTAEWRAAGLPCYLARSGASHIEVVPVLPAVVSEVK